MLVRSYTEHKIAHMEAACEGGPTVVKGGCPEGEIWFKEIQNNANYNWNMINQSSIASSLPGSGSGLRSPWGYATKTQGSLSLQSSSMDSFDDFDDDFDIDSRSTRSCSTRPGRTSIQRPRSIREDIKKSARRIFGASSK